MCFVFSLFSDHYSPRFSLHEQIKKKIRLNYIKHDLDTSLSKQYYACVSITRKIEREPVFDNRPSSSEAT